MRLKMPQPCGDAGPPFGLKEGVWNFASIGSVLGCLGERSMVSKSLWMDIEVAPDAEVLDGVHECEVAVIGSGIAGLSTAYELSKRGKSVIVVDRGRICGGMTSRTSAHLAPLCDVL